MTLPVNKIICGAMPEATRIYPDGYFNCSISSPPFWALRDYGVEGQLGLEPTFEEYIDKLCNIYDEVKRVLRDDGCIFVNLGDTYSGSGGAGGDYNKGGLREGQPKYKQGRVTQAELDADAKRAKDKNYPTQAFAGYTGWDRNNIKPSNIPTKSLCLIPDRFAIEMVNRGWILRNVLIWHKPNPMPSSAKDRFTVDFEYVYFFTKRKKYWFEPQYEPHKEPWRGQGEKESNDFAYGEDRDSKEFIRQYNPLGRNKRTVWTIPTQAFPEAHFATFPEKLVEPMIKAGCPEFVCKKCGKARKKIYNTNYRIDNKNPKGQEAKAAGCNDTNFKSMKFAHGYSEHHFKGYTDCGCNAGWRPGIVLDMFRWFGDGRFGSRPIAA